MTLAACFVPEVEFSEVKRGHQSRKRVAGSFSNESPLSLEGQECCNVTVGRVPDKRRLTARARPWGKDKPPPQVAIDGADGTGAMETFPAHT